MAKSLTVQAVREQIEPGDQPAYRIWSQLGDQEMTEKEVLAAIGRIAGLFHDQDGELCDLATAGGLRLSLVMNGTLIETWAENGKATYRRAERFSSPGGSFTDMENRRLEQAQAREREQWALHDEAVQSAFDRSPQAHAIREERAFILRTLREEGSDLLREMVREELRGLLADASSTELDALRERLREARRETVAA